jgi:thiol:disulfide interchange protein
VVLAGLAAGALAGAIGLAVGLYFVITAALGSALSGNWQAQARLAFVVMLVGVFLTALNLYRLLTDRRPEAPAAPKAPPAPATAPATIEQVLDDLLAGRLSRDQAAAALRAMGVGRG